MASPPDGRDAYSGPVELKRLPQPGNFRQLWARLRRLLHLTDEERSIF